MVADDRERLLPKVKKTLTRWTQFGWPEAGRLLRDADSSPYAVLTKHRSGEWFAFAAKKQLRGGEDASFMPRLVKQARDSEAVLVLFVGGEPSLAGAYVFEPEMVVAEGTERTVTSKRRSGVTVLDIPAERHGAVLGDYLAGRAEPRRPLKRPGWEQATFGGRSA